MSGRDVADQTLQKVQIFVAQGEYHAAERLCEQVFAMKIKAENKLSTTKGQIQAADDERTAIYRKLQSVLEKLANLANTPFSDKGKTVTFESIAQFQNWQGIATGAAELSQVFNTYVAELSTIQQKHADLCAVKSEAESCIREMRMACHFILSEYESITKYLTATVLGSMAAAPVIEQHGKPSEEEEDRTMPPSPIASETATLGTKYRVSVNGKRLGRPPKVRTDEPKKSRVDTAP